VIRAAGLAALLLPAIAAAQAEPEPLAEAEEALAQGQALHIAVTASGGSSLGGYQAGWLYYVSEIGKLNPSRYDVDVLTGTSAGGINTFVASLSKCRPPQPDPRESLFYKTWMPMGFEDLFVPESTRADGLLDRAGFDQVLGPLRTAFETELRAGCVVDWGVVASRLEPRYVPLAGLYATPIGYERFVVRIEGQGEGQRPVVTPWVFDDVGYAQAVLPVSDPNVDTFALLRDLAFATSAFPVAFRPVELPTCLVASGEDPKACTLATSQPSKYVDGGLYDNAPIRLAYRVVRENGFANETAYLYLDAYLGRFPGPPATDEGSAEITRTSSLLAKIAGGVLLVSGQRSLVTLLEEDPAVVERMSIATAFSPQMSRELAGFFGLLQAEVREYDFFLGMYSAHHELRERSVMYQRSHLVIPDEADGATAEAWAPFHCIEATYEGTDPSACELAEAQRLVPMIQVGIERLYAWCKATPEGTLSGLGSSHCDAARAGQPPPRVHGANEPGDDWALRPGESSMEHTLRRLAWHGFVFTDLGETEASEKGSRRAVRRTLGRMVDQLAKQNGGQALLVQIAGNQGIDQLVPPGRSKPVK